MRKITAGTQAVLYGVCFVLLFCSIQVNAAMRPGVSTDKQLYQQGEKIYVHFFGAPGFSGDWACIVPSGAPDTTAGDYHYLPIGAHDGYLSFTAPGPGEYEVRVYYKYWQLGYTVSARHSFAVAGQNEAERPGYGQGFTDHDFGVTTDKKIYRQGEPIRVHFTGAPGFRGDWICIVQSGAPDNAAGHYKYIPEGMHQGYMIFNGQWPGNYQVRAYYNYRMNGYIVSSRYPFTVVSQSQYPVEQEQHSSDPMLKKVQYQLMKLGYDPGEADGFYSWETKTAIQEFQRDNRLQQTGEIDRETLKALGLL